MKTLLALLLAVAAAAASAARIVPANPTEFQNVDLRLETDSCTFVPSTVRVRSSANVLRVTQQPNACLLPGAPRVVDIRLGALPAGEYAVEVYATPEPSATPVERLSFQVTTPVEIAVFPPPPRPLTDYTGVWWAPGESGWGLFLYQSALSHTMFGAWCVYGSEGRPEWFTLQAGRWTSSTTWTATVYRSTGPSLGRLPYDPGLVRIAPVGTATLDFTQTPGTEGRAQLRYDVDGIGGVSKAIQRFTF
jgi:hypothetical protein